MTRRLTLRVAAVVVLVISCGATYPGAELVALASALRRERATEPVTTAHPGLPWLHVEHPAGATPFIADPERRRVILRGVAVAGLIDWWSGTDKAVLTPPPRFPIDPAAYAGRCPTNSDLIRVPPVCEEDFAQIVALGFNVVRLGVSWSLLESAPRQYSRLYVDRIAQVVGWARAHGIYVILDMHQDAYSRYLPRPVPPPLPNGAPPSLNDHDGAPAWAVTTDGLPSERFMNQREINPAMGAAFTNFWLNVGGVQDHYIRAAAMLARRFRDDSTVAGFNLFNEPWPGFITPPLFEDLFLLPFYRREIDAITGAGDGLPCPATAPGIASCGYPDLGIHDRGHLVFLEAEHLRSQLDFETDVPLPVSSYPNVVYAIHAYTHKFTLDALAGLPPSAYPFGGFDQSYADAEVQARLTGAALFVDEFGNEPAADASLLTSQLREQEMHAIGSTYWPWKENCDVAPTWGVYEGLFGAGRDQSCAYDHGSSRIADGPENGCLRQGKERLLARAWPLAIAARSMSYRYDSDSGAFHLEADSAAGPQTLIAVSPEITGAVAVSGAARLSEVEPRPGGVRLIHVAPLGGKYAIDLAPGPLQLTGCAP